MKTNNQQVAHIVLSWIILSVALAFATAKPAIAGPDCDRKPDHPSCSGGGGEDPPVACSASTTFPTFVYWDNSDNLDRMTLSDAEGACLVELLAHDNQHYFLGNSAMHFENGLGRIVWTDRWPGNEIYLTEFSVGPGNTVNVVYERSLLAALPHHEDNHGSLTDVDISPDGQSMTFIYASPNAPGAGEAEYTCIFSGSIDNWRLGKWVPVVGPDPCDETNEVVSFGPYPNGNGPHLTDIMYSADASRILYDVSGFNGWNPGTYVIDSSDGNWILPPDYRPDIIFPWDTAFIDPGDGGGTRELLLVGAGSNSINYCGDIQLIDLEKCLASNSCTAIAGPPYLSGFDASWLSDGRVVYEERIFKQRGKNLTCSNGDITLADPLDLLADPDRLFGGRRPLGWW